MARSFRFVAVNKNGEEKKTTISRDILEAASEMLLFKAAEDHFEHEEVRINVCHDVWDISVTLLTEGPDYLLEDLFPEDSQRAFNALKGLGLFISEWKVKGISHQVAGLMRSIICDHWQNPTIASSVTLRWKDEHDVVKDILEYCEEDNYPDLAPCPKLVESLVDVAADIKGKWHHDVDWDRGELDTRYVYEQFLHHMRLRCERAESAASGSESGSGDLAALVKLVSKLTLRWHLTTYDCKKFW